jgi:pimeloyl-ACP methyl ester carboxylesterase
MLEQAIDTSAGVTLNAAIGPRAGLPVVLLHGVTRRWQDWLTVIPFLVPRWQVFAFDFRGHGRSARTPGAYRVADYVEDIVDVLRRVLGEPAYLIGHSLGGNVAAMVAAEAPERVRAIVLEDPPLEMSGPRLAETPLVETFRYYVRHAGSHQPLNAIAAELAEARVPAPGLDGKVRLGDVRDMVSLRSLASGLKRLDPQVLEPAMHGRWLDGLDIPGSLRRIGCPTLLLQADWAVGGLLPDDVASESAMLIRDCVHMKLARIGHNVHATAIEAMMRLVVPFLSSLD